MIGLALAAVLAPLSQAETHKLSQALLLVQVCQSHIDGSDMDDLTHKVDSLAPEKQAFIYGVAAGIARHNLPQMSYKYCSANEYKIKVGLDLLNKL